MLRKLYHPLSDDLLIMTSLSIRCIIVGMIVSEYGCQELVTVLHVRGHDCQDPTST